MSTHNIDHKLLELIKLQNTTGLVIDCSWMEASGGGPYPAYICVDGKYTLLTEDIGEIAYTLLSINVEMPVGSLKDHTIYVFGYFDKGPTLCHISDY